MSDDPVKSHPDYSRGYFDALEGHAAAPTSEHYRAGYEAGAKARDLFRAHGFIQDGPRQFSKTMKV